MDLVLPSEFKDIASVLQVDAQILGDYSIKAIDARHLQDVLGSTKDHNTWIKAQIRRCMLEQNIDYEVLTQEGEYVKNPKNGDLMPGKSKKQYILTVEAAKEIATISQTPKGKQVRKYFLHMEKIAQESYQQELLVVDSKDAIAAQEFDYMASVMSKHVGKWWGQGYVQKQVAMIAVDVDQRHHTNISRFIPAPTALPMQKEEVDVTKGEHLLRQAVGSKELSTVDFAKAVGLDSTTPFNETLIALGYQRRLKASNRRGVSGYALVEGKELYANQIPISTHNSPFKGKHKITSWIFNSFTEAEIDKIKLYAKLNFPRNCTI